MVIAGIIVSFFIVRSVFYEKKEVSTEDWYASYEFDSEDPYGAKVFYELIKDKYGEDNLIKNHKDTLISEIESSGNLYILFSHRRYLSTDKQEDIKDFIAKGNNAIIISSNYNASLTDTLEVTDIPEVETEEDSIFTFKFVDFEETMSYKHYSGSNFKAVGYHPNTFEISDSYLTTSLANQDSLNSVFFRTQLDTGVIYQHGFPELFSNIASKQDFYLKHFNATFSYLEGERVIIDHPNYDNRFEDIPTESPLQYILENRSLKWAYYTFLFTTIGFIIFRGKRKQRMIPIPERNENTSIQYVDTLSSLFEHQNQNEKLVPHLETVFIQRVKKKYYLSPDNEKFVELLSKKSRIPENQISAILKYFETGKGIYNFSDDQLIMLHKRLEDFYKNAE